MKHPIWNSNHNSFGKYAVVITAAFAIFLGFIATNSVFRWVKAGFEIKRQNRQIETYKQEIDRMEREIQLLTHDKDSLEKFAREHFHFAAPGEDVYIVED
ncbi:MAG: septum formation initiator family protein [Bacteroidales bacterium]|nr:septum formation initiator family protein [Bacteroidales bacterium]